MFRLLSVVSSPQMVGTSVSLRSSRNFWNLKSASGSPAAILFVLYQRSLVFSQCLEVTPVQIYEPLSPCMSCLSDTLPSEIAAFFLGFTPLCHSQEYALSQKAILEHASSVSVLLRCTALYCLLSSVLNNCFKYFAQFYIWVWQGSTFNNCYSIMTETKSPHFGKSGIAMFLTVNALLIFKKCLFTNLAI